MCFSVTVSIPCSLCDNHSSTLYDLSNHYKKAHYKPASEEEKKTLKLGTSVAREQNKLLIQSVLQNLNDTMIPRRKIKVIYNKKYAHDWCCRFSVTLIDDKGKESTKMCNLIFETPTALEYHQSLIHAQELKKQRSHMKYPCNIDKCTREFTSESSLSTHRSKMHYNYD
jgi:Zinc finger, C2H2 type